MIKESSSKLKPTTLMAVNETLRSVYARNAPDIPKWFRGNQEGIITDEELFLKWLEYYSELMLKHFSK